MRNQANTAMFNANSGLLDELSSTSFSESNTYYYTHRNSSHPQDEQLLATLKSKCTTTSQSKIHTMAKASPEPITEPSKTGDFRAPASKARDSKLQLMSNTSARHEPWTAKNQYAGRMPQVSPSRESPAHRRSEVVHPSTREQAKRYPDGFKVVPGRGKERAAPIVLQTDEAPNQRVSPYKLIMFGEKDMYYKKHSQPHNKASSEIKIYREESHTEPAEEQHDGTFERE